MFEDVCDVERSRILAMGVDWVTFMSVESGSVKDATMHTRSCELNSGKSDVELSSMEVIVSSFYHVAAATHRHENSKPSSY